MADITFDQSVERGVVADITGYMPAAAAASRGQRQEARYKLRSSLRRVRGLERCLSFWLPPGGVFLVGAVGGVEQFLVRPSCRSGARRRVGSIDFFFFLGA